MYDAVRSTIMDASGYVGGTVGLLVIAAVCVHCMHLLVQSKQRLAEGYPFDHLSYSVGASSSLSDVIHVCHSYLLGCCKTHHGACRRVPGQCCAFDHAGEAE